MGSPDHSLEPTVEISLESLRNAAASSLGVFAEEVELQVLPGDASDRRFYRARSAGGETRVVMQLETPLPAPEDPDRVPYINILHHLTLCKAAVPKLHAYDPVLGLLILEDLGDETLEGHVERAGLEASLPLYREAIRELVTLQVTGTRKRCDHCMAFHHRFDTDKLMWEMDFFLEHTVKGHLGRGVAERDEERLRGAFRDLCRVIASEPLYFTHRDYHSRNIMVRGHRIGIVDFQDARLGPLQYDLCSLLRDSYVSLPEEMVEELLGFYLEQRDAAEGTRTDRAAFRRIFDWTSVQRNLKAAGTFGYMAEVKGKKNYLPYLPGTFAYVRKNLRKYPELGDLRKALGKVLPEIL